MSKTSWQGKLRRTFRRQSKAHNPLRVAIVGVGHELRGDDAAGIAVARKLRPSERVLVVDAGAAPENFAGCLHDFQPHLALFVDAAQINQPPGAVALLACEAIAGISASTHTLPLDVLAHFLALDSGCEVALLGIQPQTTALGAALSPAVERAVNEAARELERALEQT